MEWPLDWNRSKEIRRFRLDSAECHRRAAHRVDTAQNSKTDPWGSSAARLIDPCNEPHRRILSSLRCTDPSDSEIDRIDTVGSPLRQMRPNIRPAHRNATTMECNGSLRHRHRRPRPTTQFRRFLIDK